MKNSALVRFAQRKIFAALSCVLLAPLVSFGAEAPSYSLRSPGGEIEVSVHVGDRLRYDVAISGGVVLKDATLSLKIDAATLGVSPHVRTATPRSHDGIVIPTVHQKAASYRDRFNELRLELDGNCAVVFRAYDEGVAYRWETSLPGESVKVFSEEVTLNFADNYTVYYPEEESFFSHNERHYLPRALGDLAAKNLASIPAVVEVGRAKVVIAESDVVDYPGLWLHGTGKSGLAGTFPPFPLKETLRGDRDFRVTEPADYIAVTKGTRTFPWRVLGIATRDIGLIGNPLVYLLERPSELADTSWIKPGKVAWDWWNALNLQGVNFKAGINNTTYKYYIDFAAKNGLDYIILDEGWYKLGNLLELAPDINVEELVAYGKQKNVGVILWVVWKTLDDQLQPALDRFAKWGVRGIKVDFMQRDDQVIMNYYAKICREAAQRHLLVDFHGAIRPALMTRTWPNLISTEGVRGLEWNKWSSLTTPEHDATLPFTRMFVGPMDYTPGAMLNATRYGFEHVFNRPMSQGTRCHQLALYVVFESPLQMLADSPTNYEREPEAMEFLSAVPTVWDETRGLDGRISDYVVIARRSGSDWYLGAITDWTPRDLTVDLSFLPAGNFQLTEWADGANANERASDFNKSTRTVTNATKFTLHLAEGGGYAARIRTN